MEFALNKYKSQFRFHLLIVYLVVLTGCASTSVFIPYPQQATTYKSDLNNASVENSLNKLNRRKKSADKILYLMESGRLNQLNNNFDASLEDFRAIIDQFNIQDEKARVSATGTLGFGSSLLTNDNAIPYRGEGYERVLVHHYQALNYLAKGDRQSALVEVRRANLEQTIALDKHERELAKAEKEAGNQDIKSDGGQYGRYFSSMDQIGAQVKSSFQNAYTFYLSGLIYEANGDYNDAYIDYKKALEIFPQNHFIQSDLLRLAQQLGMQEDLRYFQKKFNIKSDLKKDKAYPNGKGSLIILYEHGFVPVKQEISIPLITTQGIQQVAFPTYQQAWLQPQSLNFTANNSRYNTEPIVYTSALAVKALQERIPGMIIRQTLRATAKKELQNQANEQNPFLGLSTQIYNLVSERADLRGWSTLPYDAQIARLELKANIKQVLSFSTGKHSKTVEIDVKPGQIVILKLTDTGSRLIIQKFTL